MNAQNNSQKICHSSGCKNNLSFWRMDLCQVWLRRRLSKNAIAPAFAGDGLLTYIIILQNRQIQHPQQLSPFYGYHRNLNHWELQNGSPERERVSFSLLDLCAFQE